MTNEFINIWLVKSSGVSCWLTSLSDKIDFKTNRPHLLRAFSFRASGPAVSLSIADKRYKYVFSLKKKKKLDKQNYRLYLFILFSKPQLLPVVVHLVVHDRKKKKLTS